MPSLLGDLSEGHMQGHMWRKRIGGPPYCNNERGNVMVQDVMVQEAPTSFSPFSLANCTLLSYFSFNDFIAIAFLDLARDLDIQI